MQTHLADFIKDTAAGREADGILRSCVHCGFCTATCPTFQLLGDELDVAVELDGVRQQQQRTGQQRWRTCLDPSNTL